MYEVPVAQLDRNEVKKHLAALTMQPKDTFQKGDGSFPAYEVRTKDGRPETLAVPRFYGLEHFGRPEHEDTTEGAPICDEHAHFAGALQPHQVEATGAVWEAWQRGMPVSGGIVVLGCGQGKTVCALNLISRLKRRTLVLCHKAFLLDQWCARAKTFLPNATLGLIRQKTATVDADIVMASLQSVAMRDYPSGTFDGFGLMIIDEAHHIAAPVLSKGLAKLPTRYMLSLSATPERRDALPLHHSVGPILFRAARPKNERVLITRMVYKSQWQTEIVGRDGKPQFARMLNRLAEDAQRTAWAAVHVSKLLRKRRQVIVLSDRIQQLETLCSAVLALGHAKENAAFYIGRCSDAERREAEEKQLLLSTYAMAREGLDIGRLDTLCLLSPSSSVEQAVGRILRPCSEKQTPLVLDLVDGYSVFQHMAAKRLRFYQKSQYEIQDVTADWDVNDARLYS
tara:strand:- start:1228 stop:2589 length:1362 start_codon:yes stop_codon:yes gene_type:complete